MQSGLKILNHVKIVGGLLLTVGIFFFLFGIFASGYSKVTFIGIGTIMGAVFIFLMGMFLVASEEIVDKSKN